MSTPLTYTFEFSEGPGIAHDASVSEKSLGRKIEGNYAWFLNPIVTGLTSNDSTYTLEVSHEDVDGSYTPYNATLTGAVNDLDYKDSNLAPLWVRINYIKGTETTGTVVYPISLKRP